MNRERVVVVLCAACCCFALVTLSSSLDATVSGSPEDEFDVGADELPLSDDDTGELKDAYQSGSGAEGESSSSDQNGEGAPAAAESQNSDTGEQDGDASSDASSTRTATDQAADRSAAQSADASDSDSGSSQSGEGTGLTTQDEQRDWLATARDLLSGVLGLGVVGAVGTLGWLAVRYRERLLGRVVGDHGGGERFGTAGSTDGPTFEPPANEIERVWVEMAERGDVAIDPGMTPSECADRLEADGFDRDAVEELTDLFQRVRYGSAVTTSDRVERARECLQRSVPTTDGGERQ